MSKRFRRVLAVMLSGAMVFSIRRGGLGPGRAQGRCGAGGGDRRLARTIRRGGVQPLPERELRRLQLYHGRRRQPGRGRGQGLAKGLPQPAEPMEKAEGKMMAELKSCPFCGGKAVVKTSSNSVDRCGLFSQLHSVSCSKCGATTAKHTNRSFVATLMDFMLFETAMKRQRRTGTGGLKNELIARRNGALPAA